MKRNKALKKAPLKASLRRRTLLSDAIVFDLDVRSEGIESILGAAYLLTDRAYACLEGDRDKRIKLTLCGKKQLAVGGLKSLAETFIRELDTQKVRWAIAKNNLPVREHIAEQAVLLANGKLQSSPSSDELSDDQRKEIERLISEVEDEIKAMNQNKTAADPKNIAATWEEKQEKKQGSSSKSGPA